MPQQSQLAVQTRARGDALKSASLRTSTLVLADTVAVLAVVIAAYVFHSVTVGQLNFDLEQLVTGSGIGWHGWGTLLVLSVLLTFFASRGHYTGRIPFWSEVSTVTGGVVIAFLSDTFIRASIYGVPVGFEHLLRWAMLIPLLILAREGARQVMRACHVWELRTLVVGYGAAVDRAKSVLTCEPKLGYRVTGTLDLRRATLWGRMDEGRDLLREHGAEFVVVAGGDGDADVEGRLVATLAREKVPFAIIPAIEGLPVSGVTSQYFFSQDALMLVCGNNLARPICQSIKSLFDQSVAFLALLMLSPMFLALSVLVRLDGGPALFGHVRIGAGGKKFKCFKFRSMVVDGDAVLQEHLRTNAAAREEWLATRKLRDDPRVTRLGAFLRKTSLDELPQLLNVLRGEMSLVGPRPIVDAEVPRYGEDIAYYYETKPGITGLWQVSGRSNTTYQHRVKLDVWYVRNWTLWHDVAILLKTVRVVLKKEGAV